MSSSSNTLRPGDVVEVRPWAEIDATLDENGMAGDLAFMPEMLKHCGRRFVVSKQIAGGYEGPFSGARVVHDVVLLRDARCDGSGHNACKKACVLCWKQAWLSKVDPAAAAPPPPAVADDESAAFPYRQADGRYRCQYDETVVVGSSVAQPPARTGDSSRQIHRMSLEEYASLQEASGETLVCVEGHWWRQVRPCFFRPLLPFRELRVNWRELPPSAWLGGAQHVVPCGQEANSTMSFLMFRDGADYSIDSLRSKARRQVRSAAEQFAIRPMAECAAFKEQAFPVYQEFRERTQYHYLAERSNRPCFDDWADAIFEHESSLVLGAYRDAQLCAVSIAHLIEDTLIYSTVFATSEALRDHVSSLLLHTLRLKASEDGGIAQVYAGIPKTSEAQGIDDFLMRRGCQLVTRPAYTWLNPASKLLLRHLFPAHYSRIHGEPADSVAVDAEADSRNDAPDKRGDVS
ncbi:MAG TPA: hypothetical protein VMV72_02255 [Verrucomicrobiae bacterium]|nr:hypothetical protein [Verrucomicrobiae bacterium]